MGKQLVAGLAQRRPLPLGDNLTAFRADVLETVAAHPEIELLIYPEMHLHDAGHLPAATRDAALERAAVPLTSAYVRELGSIARAAGIWLLPGSVGERATANVATDADADTAVSTVAGGYYNTVLLFNPAGELVAHYRKMFPWRPYEPHHYGTEFVVHQLSAAAATTTTDTTVTAAAATATAQRLGRVTLGLSNCYDAWFPEHSRHLAWFGADVIANVVKTTSDDRQQELVLAQANALVNQVFMLSVNCAEPTGRGHSIAVDPEGRILAQAAGTETTLVVRCDLQLLERVRQTGTCGTNRVWAQFTATDQKIPLPLYSGHIDPASWQPAAQQHQREE